MTPSLRRLRDLIDSGAVDVVVTDLDGVLRVFDPLLWARLDEAAGLAPGTVYSAVLGHPYLDEVVRGRGTHAQWRRRAAESLIEEGAAPGTADAVIERWASTPAAVDDDVLRELQRCRREGLAVFVLTNGTDRVPEELAELGLEEFLGPERRFLLNTADLGAAKPEAEAFERARRRIEEVLGGPVRRDGIVLLDDSGSHVRGAEDAGWRAIHHPGAGRGAPLP